MLLNYYSNACPRGCGNPPKISVTTQGWELNLGPQEYKIGMLMTRRVIWQNVIRKSRYNFC
jgi:hypothetical protein